MNGGTGACCGQASQKGAHAVDAAALGRYYQALFAPVTLIVQTTGDAAVERVKPELIEHDQKLERQPAEAESVCAGSGQGWGRFLRCVLEYHWIMRGPNDCLVFTIAEYKRRRI